MAETYCGKTCAECSKREELNCPGCRPGPGRELGGTCEIAMCCHRKGHETCETCGFRSSCATVRKKWNMPEYRLQKIEADKMVQKAIARRAPVLGKWLWILFWLVIPANVASFMTMESVVEWLPQLRLPGEILSLACNLTYSLILLRLASEEEGYRTAGICGIISSAVSALAASSSAQESPAWALLVTIPMAVVALVGEYNEFTAHATVLAGVHNEQSDKWENLWKWNIGMYAALLGSTLLLVIIPVIGAIVLIGSTLGMLVVSILKLVYLYRTAKIFRDYRPGE